MGEKLEAVFREVRKRHPDLPVLAIPWIHATNGRNGIREEVGRAGIFPIFVFLLARIPWLLFRASGLWLRQVLRRRLFARSLRELESRTFDGLAKTWVFTKVPSEERDFYFGDLAARMKGLGIRLLMICNASRFTPGHIPEAALIPPFAIFRTVFRQCRAAAAVFREAVREKEQLTRAVLLLAGRDVLRFQTLRNALFYWVGKEALRRWPVRFFVTLYEGTSWEKCLWMGIREAAPACRLVGYQHTVILQESFELMNPSNDAATLRPPEIILNTGNIPARLMRPGHAGHKTRFVPFGSFQFGREEGGAGGPRPDRKSVLVLPEGIVPEMIFLFDAAMEMASLLPDHRFVLRCHPAIPFGKIRSRLRGDPDGITNLTLSRAATVDEDFQDASHLLYRGTSAVLYAVLAGLKPFYLERDPDEENLDPLFELAGWRERAASLAEMARKIKTYSKSRGEDSVADWREARRYVRDYVMPVEVSSLDRLAVYLLNGSQESPFQNRLANEAVLK